MSSFKYSKVNSLLSHFKNGINLTNTGLEIIFGAMGSGKSTLIAKDYFNWRKNPNHVHFYSNVKLPDCDNYHYLDLVQFRLTDYMPINDFTKKYNCYSRKTNKMGQIIETPFYIEPDSIIEIDEIGILYNNRNWKSFPQEFVNFVKLLRKFNIFMICYSQAYDIDKALKNSAQYLRIMNKFGYWSITRLIFKKPALIIDEHSDMKNEIGDLYKYEFPLKRGAITITFIPFYTALFNTLE